MQDRERHRFGTATPILDRTDERRGQTRHALLGESLPHFGFRMGPFLDTPKHLEHPTIAERCRKIILSGAIDRERKIGWFRGQLIREARQHGRDQFAAAFAAT